MTMTKAGKVHVAKKPLASNRETFVSALMTNGNARHAPQEMTLRKTFQTEIPEKPT